MEKNKNNGSMIAVIAVLVLLVVFGGLYLSNRSAQTNNAVNVQSAMPDEHMMATTSEDMMATSSDHMMATSTASTSMMTGDHMMSTGTKQY